MKKILISIGVIGLLSFSYYKKNQEKPDCFGYVDVFKEFLLNDYKAGDINKFTYDLYTDVLNTLEKSIKNHCDCYDPASTPSNQITD